MIHDGRVIIMLKPPWPPLKIRYHFLAVSGGGKAVVIGSSECAERAQRRQDTARRRCARSAGHARDACNVHLQTSRVKQNNSRAHGGRGHLWFEQKASASGSR